MLAQTGVFAAMPCTGHTDGGAECQMVWAVDVACCCTDYHRTDGESPQITGFTREPTNVENVHAVAIPHWAKIFAEVKNKVSSVAFEAPRAIVCISTVGKSHAGAKTSSCKAAASDAENGVARPG
jgi:hypothetical protein